MLNKNCSVSFVQHTIVQLLHLINQDNLFEWLVQNICCVKADVQSWVVQFVICSHNSMFNDLVVQLTFVESHFCWIVLFNCCCFTAFVEATWNHFQRHLFHKRNETDCKNISNVQIVAGGILLLSFVSYSTIGIETLTSMLVTSHPVYVEPAALAIGLLQLALESCESGRVCCFCPVGERPALVIHHWVATEDIFIWVNRA